VDQPSPSDLRKLMNRPLIKETDMNQEMQVDVIDAISSGLENNQIINVNIDKNANPAIQVYNYEVAAKCIKDSLDKKFGPSWHCILGEGYAVDVTMQKKSLMFLFYGNCAVLIFKS